MTLLRVAVQTLGGKLNQLETESVADRFLATGAKIVPFHEEADLYVVNTCTVTSKAEQKARHDIRAALAKVPRAVVVATGCYAQMEPGALAALGERVIVIPGDLKASLLALAEWLSENWQGMESFCTRCRSGRRRFSLRLVWRLLQQLPARH
jgi:threonylcarbamoyladenosine tRNA methylthiotransferase MtaB